MEGFLKDNKLDHLTEALSTLGIDECFGLLEKGRPKLLERLKELGVTRIPDRQAVAKAISNGRRELLGVGLPIIVCTYSTGLLPKDGQALMKPILDAASAAGFKDQIVLDHSNEAPYAGKCATLDEYVRAMIDVVYAKNDEWRGRPWVIVGHSNGPVGAYGLARKLGPKVRALCVLSRRPPSMPLIPDVFGVQTCAEFLALPVHEVAQTTAKVYTNPQLAHYTSKPDESQWLEGPRNAIAAARAQYGSPCVLCAAEDIAAALGDVESLPPSSLVSAPVLGIPSSQETEAGETARKMEGWAALTTASFELAPAVDAAHMDMPKEASVVERIVGFFKPFLPQ